MFIRVTKSPSGSSCKVYLVEAYRNHEGKQRQRILKKYGDLDAILAKDPNGLEKLKAKYKNSEKEGREDIILNRKTSAESAKESLNYGYFYLEQVYKQLGISHILKKEKEHSKIESDLDSIMKLLVYTRIMNPSSKYTSYKNRDKFFEPFKVSLQSIYRSLSVFNKIKDEIQMVMHQNIQKEIGRDLSLVLYDLTNYYFETEKADDLKKPGVSKERKITPIVQMGLLIDKNKIPVGYQLFPGNVHDSKTAIPMIKKLKEKFGVKRTILTADKGINTSINFASLVAQGDGYIVSQKIRGSKKEFIEEVLNDDGYTYWGSDFKYKEVFQKRDVKVNNEIITLHEKVVIYWAKNFDIREKHKREELDKKIEKYLNSPAVLNASNAHGIKRYIKIKHLDKATGEVKKVNPKNIFDEEKYDRDVALDGYYAIVTSELDKPVGDILSSYKELWKIEESFKVIKSDLEGRPVYVRREDRIEGHFLTCFIALTILRIIERKLKYKYSCSKIKESLFEANIYPLNKDDYLLYKKSDVIKKLEYLNESYIKWKYPTLEELRRLKKGITHYKNKD